MTDRVTYLSALTTYILGDALLDLAIKLPMIRYQGIIGTWYYGTPSTITDPYLPSTNDLFTGGTVICWFKSLAPIVYWRVSAVVANHTGNILTLRPSATMAAGAGYSVFNASFPYWLLLQSINLALQDFGDIPVTKFITTVANQQEYDYSDSAAIMTGNQVIGVEIAGSTTEPYNYVTHHNWEMKHNATTGMTLCFDPGHIPAGGYKMRLTYMCKHLDVIGKENLVVGSDDWLEIAPVINPERLSWQAAVYALRWKVSEAPDEPKFAAALQEAIQRAEQAKARFPVLKPQRIRYSKWLTGR